MMKEKYNVVVYSCADNDINRVIELHKLIYKNTKLNNSLIYFDSNFKNYLIKIIGDKINVIYLLKKNKVIIGFAHIILKENSLFLNNIAIDKLNQGKGIGGMFLNEIIQQQKANSNFITLDVLKSNAKAFNWYLNMGLNIVGYTNWKILECPISISKKVKVIKKDDINGFNSLFVTNEKIATIINDDILILHKIYYLDYLEFFNFKKIITNENTIIKPNMKIIETSTRMKCEISKIKINVY